MLKQRWPLCASERWPVDQANRQPGAPRVAGSGVSIRESPRNRDPSGFTRQGMVATVRQQLQFRYQRVRTVENAQ